MKFQKNLLLLVCICLIFFFIRNNSFASESKAKYHITAFNYEVTEDDDEIHFFLTFDVWNHTTENLYATLNFEKIIRENLVSMPPPIKVPPNGSTATAIIVKVRKDKELTTSVVDKILNKELHPLLGIIVGEQIQNEDLITDEITNLEDLKEFVD